MIRLDHPDASALAGARVTHRALLQWTWPAGVGTAEAWPGPRAAAARLRGRGRSIAERADFRRDSESTRKFAPRATVSPSERPAVTSYEAVGLVADGDLTRRRAGPRPRETKTTFRVAAVDDDVVGNDEGVRASARGS